MTDAFLTIDWDAYVQKPQMADCSFGEFNTNLSMLWAFRVQFIRSWAPRKDRHVCWPALLPSVHTEQLYVSDSHLNAVMLASHFDTIVLVDAHHDCYGKSWDNAVRNNLHCGNWLAWWLSKRKRRKVVWYHSVGSYTTADEAETIPKLFKRRIEVRPLAALPELRQEFSFPVVHACRSGGWTPPWCDVAWLKWLKETGMELTYLADDGVDPLLRRWTPAETRSFIKQWRAGEEAVASMVTAASNNPLLSFTQPPAGLNPE